MRTILAVAVTTGLVVSGQPQAPITTPTMTVTQVVGDRTPRLGEVVVDLGGGWQLRADRLGSVTPGMSLRPSGTDNLYVSVFRPGVTEVELTGNVRLTIRQ